MHNVTTTATHQTHAQHNTRGATPALSAMFARMNMQSVELPLKLCAQTFPDPRHKDLAHRHINFLLVTGRALQRLSTLGSAHYIISTIKPLLFRFPTPVRVHGRVHSYCKSLRINSHTSDWGIQYSLKIYLFERKCRRTECAPDSISGCILHMRGVGAVIMQALFMY